MIFTNFFKSSNLAILPSSFIISQITAEGFKPANSAISMAASVCLPSITLLHYELLTEIYDQVVKSSFPLEISITVCIVLERSAADMPVVTPFFHIL